MSKHARRRPQCRHLRVADRLAKSLGLKIITEGVEDLRELEWLAASGCDQVQGYLIGRPMPLDALIERLRRE